MDLNVTPGARTFDEEEIDLKLVSGAFDGCVMHVILYEKIGLVCLGHVVLGALRNTP